MMWQVVGFRDVNNAMIIDMGCMNSKCDAMGESRLAHSPTATSGLNLSLPQPKTLQGSAGAPSKKSHPPRVPLWNFTGFIRFSVIFIAFSGV